FEEAKLAPDFLFEFLQGGKRHWDFTQNLAQVAARDKIVSVLNHSEGNDHTGPGPPLPHQSMSRKKPALGLDPRVETGFAKRIC
ncbi:MAG: hypothetical protein WBD71_06955, partial [Xanthobacteraceae bacterium]